MKNFRLSDGSIITEEEIIELKHFKYYVESEEFVNKITDFLQTQTQQGAI